MSDEPEATEAEVETDGEQGGEAQEEPRKGFLGRKKLLIMLVPVLAALGGGGYFAADRLGLLVSGAPATTAKPAVYFDLPEMVVNLSSAERRAQYLKLKVSLEAEDRAVIQALQPVLPRVLDMFQLYLRELRSSDLDGSAGIFRLKEELLRRVNIEVHPNKVKRVLFKEIIVQ